jgi:thioredoxin 1
MTTSPRIRNTWSTSRVRPLRALIVAAVVLLSVLGAPLAASPTVGEPVHISHKEFKATVLRADVPVVVDFWATWCGPCRKIAPALETLAAENAGRLLVAKVNVDENLAFTHRYGVKGLPTLLVFKNGKEIGRLQGNRKPEVLEQELHALVGPTLVASLATDSTAP